MAKTYAGYAERDVNNDVNWAAVTKSISDVLTDSKSYTLSHVPFDMEPEVFNIFMFSFFAIIFLLFIDKTLSGKGIKLF